MQCLATNDLVFMCILRLGVTNVGCQRLMKVANFCPKAVHASYALEGFFRLLKLKELAEQG